MGYCAILIRPFRGCIKNVNLYAILLYHLYHLPVFLKALSEHLCGHFCLWGGERVADEGGGAFKWENNRISRVHQKSEAGWGGGVFTLHVQFNLSTTASLGREESGACREVDVSQRSTEIFLYLFFLACTYFFPHPRPGFMHFLGPP